MQSSKTRWFTDTGLTSFAEAMAAAQQVGADTVIATGAGSFNLAGIDRTSMVASDFLFAWQPEPV
jgi:hypothetical protein